ncbi:dynein regulatory complex protein 11 isoform X4 [Oxyura jamaicensis]|uniref:dynein regulatory complex protein 11 isoform X4 n=1 Tax=Oxyura jamaicensis TaxID=8884 RepID=UPI0015A6D1C2|nr:dynein regulatory complex protein 11 isoform X4 [Oxyura jamaicensis]
MSQATYNKMWTDAQKDLDIQLQTEREQFLQPEKDRVKVFKMLASSYIKYMRIFRNLEEAHDRLVHQQKRAVIRQVLDGVIGRILEMKKEMVALENSEFHYIDNILEDLKLLPEDIEIPIPRYFIKENLEVLQQREKMLDEILCNAGLQTQKPVKAMTFEEAVKMIQVAERARQGRRRAVFMKQMYLEEKTKRQTKLQVQTGPNPDDAATCIQKVWRGYIQRKKTEKMREEEMIFLGMSLPPHLKAMSSSQMHAKQVNALQGEVQERNEEVFIKDKLRETEGLDIKETLEDQIGQCFIECRHIIGRFPDYPTKEAGGSATIFSQKTPEQVAAELAAKKEAALQKKSQKEEKEKEKGKEKTKGKTQKTGKKEEDEGWKMAPSNFLSIMEEGSSQYKAVWQNRDEGWDFLQDHDLELIKEEKREEVEEEIRVQVDELMQQKLENLKLAVDGEKSGKQKKGRKSEKVAKQLQPSVVWIGETEKTFYKAVPKAEEQMNPKRLEKILPKFLKALKAQDRVLLVGTTSRPFDANLKPFCKVYQKIILIPRPDYASRFVLWKHIIQQNGGVITNLLNISCLAKVSDGFTQGHIVQVVRAVLSELRLLQMTRKPLQTAEFMTPLARQDPVYKEEEETFKVTLRAMLTGCLSSSPVVSLSAHLIQGPANSADGLAHRCLSDDVLLDGAEHPSPPFLDAWQPRLLGSWMCQASGDYYRQQLSTGSAPGTPRC